MDMDTVLAAVRQRVKELEQNAQELDELKAYIQRTVNELPAKRGRPMTIDAWNSKCDKTRHVKGCSSKHYAEQQHDRG